DLIRPDVARVALAEANSPLGSYTRSYLEERGLYAALLPHAVQVDNSHAVLATVRAGQADVGLVYGSDASTAPGLRLLFRVRRPPAAIRYAAAVVTRGRRPEQARGLLDFLVSRPAAGRFRRCGFAVAGGELAPARRRSPL